MNQVACDHSRAVEPSEVIACIDEKRPVLVTAVHCDTPTGMLNSLVGIGAAVHRHGGLFYVDFVASVGGCPIHHSIDDLEIDLGLLGSQKALSCPPDLAAVSISAPAWAVIEAVAYEGYDALLPFRTAVAQREFPYTHNWHAVAALNVSINKILSEGLEHVFARHVAVAAHCRAAVRALGLSVFTDDACSSPTVTAVQVSALFLLSPSFASKCQMVTIIIF
jgi:aspartate aminotransferase-like enzyme